jgi:micrococcal nuclease
MLTLRPSFPALLTLLVACSGTGPADTGASDTAPPDEPVDTAAEALAADDARVRALTSLPQGDAPCASPMLARVDYAVDGDTFYVYPDAGGARVKVRLIGLDTPEIEHDDPAECYGDDAYAFTREQIEGKMVWLTFDAECEDTYGRTLAYAHRDSGEAGFYNRVLLRQGFATDLEIEPNDTFASTFRDDERAARDDGSGLWSACAR